MKVKAILASCVCLGIFPFPVFAQQHSAGQDSRDSRAGARMDNNTAPIAADGAGAERLDGKSHRDYIDGLVYRDRQAIKDLRRRIKAAATSEERAELERQKRLLEEDIIALQQQN